RRRHTRSKRDWSSDVCSSDLPRSAAARGAMMGVSKWLAPLMQQYDVIWCPIHLMPYKEQWPVGAPTASLYLVEAAAEQTGLPDEIGRASCRERGGIAGGAVRR